MVFHGAFSYVHLRSQISAFADVHFAKDLGIYLS
jgi:hypothetical protein